MQNQLNSQNISQMPIPAYQSYPAPSVGAVNIQIFNPTANPIAPPQGFYQPVACNPYPYNYNNMVQQSAPIQGLPPQIDPSAQVNPAPLTGQDSMNLDKSKEGLAANADGSKGQVSETKSKKNIVPLTDDYIKTLENYLNSEDKKIRLMGAKELFDRFKEDETRIQDPALTALLNKILQDPADTVKFVGLTALDAGYAAGNNETAQILTNMQTSNSNYGEDASLASKILLKMSGNQAKLDAGIPLREQTQNEPPKNQSASENTSSLDNHVQQNQEAPINLQNDLNKLPSEGGILMTNNSSPIAANNMNSQAVVNG